MIKLYFVIWLKYVKKIQFHIESMEKQDLLAYWVHFGTPQGSQTALS